MPWGVAAGAIASVASSAISSSMSGGAAGQAQGVSQQAIKEANDNRLTDRAAYQPFVDQGTTAVNSLGDALGINGADAAASARADFQASPGYQYQVDQGLRVVDNGAAARGMLRSGATLKAEQTLGNNLANQDFGSYLTRLNALSTMGLQGAQGQANTTATYNNLMGGQASNQEAIIGQSSTQQQSAVNNGLSGLASSAKSVDWNSLFGGAGTASGNFGSAGMSSVPAMTF